MHAGEHPATCLRHHAGMARPPTSSCRIGRGQREGAGNVAANRHGLPARGLGARSCDRLQHGGGIVTTCSGQRAAPRVRLAHSALGSCTAGLRQYRDERRLLVRLGSAHSGALPRGRRCHRHARIGGQRPGHWRGWHIVLRCGAPSSSPSRSRKACRHGSAGRARRGVVKGVYHRVTLGSHTGTSRRLPVSLRETRFLARKAPSACRT